MADVTLDAKGLNCPLPILKAKKALKEVPAGGTLEILSTDPGSAFAIRLVTNCWNQVKMPVPTAS